VELPRSGKLKAADPAPKSGKRTRTPKRLALVRSLGLDRSSKAVARLLARQTLAPEDGAVRIACGEAADSELLAAHFRKLAHEAIERGDHASAKGYAEVGVKLGAHATRALVVAADLAKLASDRRAKAPAQSWTALLDTDGEESP
jgi:hypothetical protein